MPAAEPPTGAAAPAQHPAKRAPAPVLEYPIARAFARIAELRAAGFDLVYPHAGELARLRKGAELIIIRAQHNVQGAA